MQPGNFQHVILSSIGRTFATSPSTTDNGAINTVVVVIVVVAIVVAVVVTAAVALYCPA